MRLRPTHAIATGAALLGLVVAAPALAGVGHASDPGGQPPPGTSAKKTTDFVPGGQPPAGSKAATTTDFVLGAQPRNPNLQRTAKAPKVRDTDRGVKNLPARKDRGKKNLPVSRDLGR